MSEYNFIRLKPTERYASIIDSNSKPRLICFKNKVLAKSVVRSMYNFRTKFGHWPRLDLSTPKQELRIDNNLKKFEKRLEVVTLDDDELEMICSCFNLSMLYCHSFEMEQGENENYLNILLSAQEIDSNVDDHKFRSRLNNLINE